jgi:hypothetical protein
MRWWLNTDDPQIFAVDNASVNGMDFSSLPTDLWMVHWIDGKGELENQVDPLTNDNGLRTTFIDVTPYASLFQQFLALVPMLTLGQAQQVQTDLIKQIFESKRQDPFHYPVAAGDYSWDASDEALYSSPGAQLQNNIAWANQLNTAIPALNNNDATIVSQGNALIEFINNKMLGIPDGSNTINDRLRAPPGGLDSPGIAHTTVAFAVTPVPWTALSGAPSMQWIPVGGTAPVAVTSAEQTAILNGIAARTNTLAGKKNVKVAEVKALTLIPDVINYDVTTGWT